MFVQLVILITTQTMSPYVVGIWIKHTWQCITQNWRPVGANEAWSAHSPATCNLLGWLIFAFRITAVSTTNHLAFQTTHEWNIRRNKRVSNYLKLFICYMLKQAREFLLKLFKRWHHRFRMCSVLDSATRSAIQCLVTKQCKYVNGNVWNIILIIDFVS